jgi:hypothetical protein
MKKILLTLAVLGFFVAFTSESYGQVTRRADQRQKNQKHRVKKGAKSGEITKREGKSIKRSSTHAKRYEKRAKSDGQVTWVERRRLERKQDKTSRKIYRTKHNKRDRN